VCGIAGVFQTTDLAPVSEASLRKMLAALRHRGPDEYGIYRDAQVGLASARLSIVDLSRGQQPISNEDGSLWIVFNGEIFNYVELRDELAARGHRFRTRSDTEVLLHAYREYGEDCVRHFNGQWAFAIWDRRERKLFLSRDRLGVRPLFYASHRGTLFFASEIKAIFADPHIGRELDPRGLNQLFTFWTTIPPTTVFRSVQELPPGHNLIVRKGELSVRPYWQLDYSERDEFRSIEECAEQLRELMADAIRIRLRADVPVGAYLSGGLDSSLTAALAQQASGSRLRTFSVTFTDPEYDESSYQEELVRFLGVEHRAMPCSQADIARVFPEVIWHTEKPVLRTAPVPLYLLSKLVHDSGFKVVLTGEGADEIFGGYDIFKEAKVRRFCARQPDSRKRAELFETLYPYLPKMQAQSVAMRRAFFQASPGDVNDPLFSHLPRWALTSQLKRFFHPDFLGQDQQGPLDAELRALLPAAFAGWSPFCRAQYLEASLLLPGYILSSQGDRVALAHAVEGRFPFLDHRVVEFAARILPRWKMKGLNEKFILKRTLGHLLPREIVQRPKQPYRAPDASSFYDVDSHTARETYIDEMLSAERLRTDGIFIPEAVSRLVAKARQTVTLGLRDNMSLVGILSTQLLVDQFVRNSPSPAGTAVTSMAMPMPVPMDAPMLISQETT